VVFTGALRSRNGRERIEGKRQEKYNVNLHGGHRDNFIWPDLKKLTRKPGSNILPVEKLSAPRELQTEAEKGDK